MLEPWARQVEENAAGRVKIEIYPAMTLGGRPQELVQQVRDGVVDIIWTVNGYTPGIFPRTEVFELPFVFVNDPKATNLAMPDMFESRLKEIGRASCRERGCQSGYLSVVAVSLKKNTINN